MAKIIQVEWSLGNTKLTFFEIFVFLLIEVLFLVLEELPNIFIGPDAEFKCPN